MTALNPLSYQLVTDSWRLVAEVLGLGLHSRLHPEQHEVLQAYASAITEAQSLLAQAYIRLHPTSGRSM
jgi:hypothetical protein